MKKLVSLFSLIAIIGITQLAIAQNLVSNGDFELGSTEWKPFSKSSGSEPAAFDSWLAWTIAGPGSISTRLTDEIVAQGSYSGHLKTKSHGDAIFQYANRTSGAYTLSAWIYVVSGSPIIGIGYDNGMSSVYSNPIYPTGKWEYIKVTGPNITSGQSGPAIKAINTSSEFFIDALWMNSGLESISPYDPSTGFEPGPISNGIVVPEGFGAEVVAISQPGYHYWDIAINPNNELIATVGAKSRIPGESYIAKINFDGSESIYANINVDAPFAAAFGYDVDSNIYFSETSGYWDGIHTFLEYGDVFTLNNTFIGPIDIDFSPNDYNSNIYVADVYDGIIYKVDVLNGSRVAFATGFSPDSTGYSLMYGYWLGITFNSQGILFASDGKEGTISKVFPSGIVEPFVNGFLLPAGMDFSSCGDLYVADVASGTVYSVSPDGSITPFASGLGLPFRLAIDANDELYVLDLENIDLKNLPNHPRIIKISGTLCPDKEGPDVYNVLSFPAQVSSTALVTATIDETETGELTIASAQCTLDDGLPIEMEATDEHFDEIIEDVSVEVTAPSIPGLYEVCVSGYDEVNNLGGPVCTFLPVYDPDGGFVTGGGWINAPEGAYKPDPLLTGKANFGFVSKYKKGAIEPDGQAEFKFQMANINFHSNNYDWLIITGSDYAKFKGEGLINEALAPNENPYKFLIWAGDNTSNIGLDTFRIKIWYEMDDSEIIIYDNEQDAEIEGGNILVHKK